MSSMLVDMVPFFMLIFLMLLYIVHAWSRSRVVTHETAVISSDQYLDSYFISEVVDTGIQMSYTCPPSPETPLPESPEYKLRESPAQNPI